MLVTGASRGVGAATAQAFARCGDRVVVHYRGAEQRARDVLGALPGEGHTMIRADLSSPQETAALAEQAVEALGRVDVLVNNAGWDVAGPFLESDPQLWDRIMRINLHGVFHTSYAVMPHMAQAGSGAVVNVSSDAGRVGSSGEAVYSAAKGGVIAFTKTMARETARHGLRVNAVCPGPTDTALFASIGGDNPKLREALTKAIPMRRLGQPEDLANAVAFLASDEAAFITGQTLSVSGGLTMS